MYARVVDDEVIGTATSLPSTWTREDGATVSNYDSSTDEEAKLDGWYPIVEVKPTLEVDELLSAPVYTIGENQVTATYTAVPEPVEATNQRDLEQKVRLLLQDASSALATLQTQRDSPQVDVTNVAQAQTVSRQLQNAIKDQARIQQEHIKRTVALARIMTGEFDSTSDT